jgi:flagellar hook-basal body complex protein FliE
VSAEAVAALSALSQGSSAAPVASAVVPTAAPGVDAAGQFGQLVSDGLGKVNESLLAAQAGMQGLAAGTAPDLHRVMIQMEESQLSFQLMLQVRNRLLEAYQDVMKMQV